jgi:hypothetical protein
MGVFVNAMISPFLNWKTTVRFFVWITRQRRPFMNLDRYQFFWAKWTGRPPKCIHRLEAGQMSQSS